MYLIILRLPKAPRVGPEVDPKSVIQDRIPSSTPHIAHSRPANKYSQYFTGLLANVHIGRSLPNSKSTGGDTNHYNPRTQILLKRLDIFLVIKELL